MSGHFLMCRTLSGEVMAKTGTGTAASKAKKAVSAIMMLGV
jgi:hypothetical protein